MAIAVQIQDGNIERRRRLDRDSSVVVDFSRSGVAATEEVRAACQDKIAGDVSTGTAFKVDVRVEDSVSVARRIDLSADG